MQMGKIAAVHRKDEIEGFEITGIDLPAALTGNIDPVFQRNCDRAVIRRIADMPTARSGRIGIHQTIACDMPQNALGQG